MTKRMLIILSLSLVSLAIIIGGIWCSYSEQWAEQRLQDYIGRLEDSGSTPEECSPEISK